jgi:calcium-dependent protein kinase
VAKGSYSEKDAAALVRDIVRVVAHCHSMGVMHRDLKPENFLLESRADNAGIKCTDFGLSVFFKPGQKFKEVVGSAYYVAPEVLKQSYSMEADIWCVCLCVCACCMAALWALSAHCTKFVALSRCGGMALLALRQSPTPTPRGACRSCGVILYILLSGVPPFWGETEKQIFKAILEASVDGRGKRWREGDCVFDLLMHAHGIRCMPMPSHKPAAAQPHLMCTAVILPRATLTCRATRGPRSARRPRTA